MISLVVHSSWYCSDVSLNKLTCFQRLENEGVPVPTFTTHRETAHVWLQEGCRRIYERHVLRGSEGEGIRIVEATAEGEIQGEGLTDAPLYVKGMHGVRREYRIHVFQKEGVRRVFVQQKRRRTTDVEETTTKVVSGIWLMAGSSHIMTSLPPRTQTIDAAVGAIVALGLNFGGVDLIEMDDVTKGSVVLEINCAPGLQGGTLDFYAHAIKAVLDGVVDEVPQEENIGPPEDDDEDMRRKMMTTTKVAVYGSLRKGMHNHRILSGAKFLGTTVTQEPYAMYSLGGFPKVVLGEPVCPIVVEVYEVDVEGLVRLDQLEGFYGHGRDNFYDRTQVKTSDLGKAWIYHIERHNQSMTTNLIGDGDWVKFLRQIKGE